MVTVFRELRSGVTERRPDDDQVAVGHAVGGRGDLGDHQRAGAVRALRRRPAAPGRCGGRAGRRGDQGPGRRPGRLDRVPRGRGPRTRRLVASSTPPAGKCRDRRGSPRGDARSRPASTRSGPGVRHPAPRAGLGPVAAAPALDEYRAGRGADRGTGRRRPAARTGRRADAMVPPVALLAYAHRRSRRSRPSGRTRCSPRSGRRWSGPCNAASRSGSPTCLRRWCWPRNEERCSTMIPT